MNISFIGLGKLGLPLACCLADAGNKVLWVDKNEYVLDKLNNDEIDRKDIITIFLALQKQNFVLANSMINLVKQWPKAPPIINEVPAMFGILLENKS